MSNPLMKAVVLLLSASAASVFAKEGAAPGNGSPAAVDSIPQWIADLNSDLFSVRQAASRSLREAGVGAVQPLAAAADGRRSEVTRRAIDVLEAFCESDDAELGQAARESLEKLTHSVNRLPAHRASQVLKRERLREQRSALAQIQRLGGMVSYAMIEEGELLVGSLVLGRRWEAGDDGLKYLTRLGRIEQLKLWGQQFSDAGLEHLSQLTGVQTLMLYTTQISDDGLGRLQAALPGTRIDLRHGALLGVSGSSDAKGCLISQVRPGTAAARAGLLLHDVITHVNGEAIPTMEALVATIARQKPGDRITVTLLRGDETLEKEITLGELDENME
jgi:hypothetical protein